MSLGQFWKASRPMLVIPLPIVTEVKPVQPSKAPIPMLFTLLGIVTEVKPEHLPYLQLAICQLVLIKTVEK